MIGLAHYLFHRSTTAIARSCYMQDLFTSEAARAKRAAGSPRVYWQTHETNATAMQLYDKVAERSGFLVYRELF